MPDNKQSPRCPYCGAEMTLEDNEDVLFWIFGEEKMYWYQCNTPSCGIHSPACHTKAGAYKAAMKRHEEPNRVLTLYNICSKECFVERHGEACDIEECLVAVEEVINDEGKTEKKIKVYTKSWDVWNYPMDEYLRGFRCWLRKPTENERKAAKWLPEKKKDGDDE